MSDDYLKVLFNKNIKFKASKISDIDGILLEEEKVIVEKAVSKRICEFTAGRVSARQLLNDFGYFDFPILSGKDRSPIWPREIAGSISHTADFCLVALGRKHEIYSIGIDVEQRYRLKKSLWRILFNENEKNQLNQYHENERQDFATLIFSAKESFFKYQYPITKSWVGFQDVEVELDKKNLNFTLTVLHENLTQIKYGSFLKGRYLFEGDKIITTIFGELS